MHTGSTELFSQSHAAVACSCGDGLYSARIATIGSTYADLLAGMTEALTAIATNSGEAATRVGGSRCDAEE